jgi:serine/threonine protein kinase
MGIRNLTGQTLGQYELRELLGVGGTGAVYRGYQADLTKQVAAKGLTPELARRSGCLERFNREAETAATLEYRHIVPAHDYWMRQGVSYVVLRSVFPTAPHLLRLLREPPAARQRRARAFSRPPFSAVR